MKADNTLRYIKKSIMSKIKLIKDLLLIPVVDTHAFISPFKSVLTIGTSILVSTKLNNYSLNL